MQMSFRNRERLLGVYLLVDSIPFTVLTIILTALILTALIIIAALAYDLGGFWIWSSVFFLAVDLANLTWKVRRKLRGR